MGLILAIIARVALYFLSAPFMIYSIVEILFCKVCNLKQRGKNLNKYFYNIALSLDQFGNVIAEHFLNDTMITGEAELLFGNADHTISYVIAHNKRNKSLTKFGKFWAWFLNFVDKGHLEKALVNNEG